MYASSTNISPSQPPPQSSSTSEHHTKQEENDVDGVPAGMMMDVAPSKSEDSDVIGITQVSSGLSNTNSTMTPNGSPSNHSTTSSIHHSTHNLRHGHHHHPNHPTRRPPSETSTVSMASFQTTQTIGSAAVSAASAFPPPPPPPPTGTHSSSLSTSSTPGVDGRGGESTDLIRPAGRYPSSGPYDHNHNHNHHQHHSPYHSHPGLGMDDSTLASMSHHQHSAGGGGGGGRSSPSASTIASGPTMASTDRSPSGSVGHFGGYNHHDHRQHNHQQHSNMTPHHQHYDPHSGGGHSSSSMYAYGGSGHMPNHNNQQYHQHQHQHQHHNHHNQSGGMMGYGPASHYQPHGGSHHYGSTGHHHGHHHRGHNAYGHDQYPTNHHHHGMGGGYPNGGSNMMHSMGHHQQYHHNGLHSAYGAGGGYPHHASPSHPYHSSYQHPHPHSSPVPPPPHGHSYHNGHAGHGYGNNADQHYSSRRGAYGTGSGSPETVGGMESAYSTHSISGTSQSKNNAHNATMPRSPSPTGIPAPPSEQASKTVDGGSEAGKSASSTGAAPSTNSGAPAALGERKNEHSSASGQQGLNNTNKQAGSSSSSSSSTTIQPKKNAMDPTADAASILLALGSGKQEDGSTESVHGNSDAENRHPHGYNHGMSRHMNPGDDASIGTRSLPDISSGPSSDSADNASQRSQQTFPAGSSYAPPPQMTTIPETDFPCPVPDKYPRRLALQYDASKLNSLHCFLRSELLEIFVVERSLARSPMHSPGSSVGRVGLRCVHCAMARKVHGRTERDEAPMAVFYPKSIAEIYRLVTSWQRCHLRKCRNLPPSVRSVWQMLRENDKSRGKTHYWVTAAKQIGLLDCQSRAGGIRFAPNLNEFPAAMTSASCQPRESDSCPPPPPAGNATASTSQQSTVKAEDPAIPSDQHKSTEDIVTEDVTKASANTEEVAGNTVTKDEIEVEAPSDSSPTETESPQPPVAVKEESLQARDKLVEETAIVVKEASLQARDKDVEDTAMEDASSIAVNDTSKNSASLAMDAVPMNDASNTDNDEDMKDDKRDDESPSTTSTATTLGATNAVSAEN